MSEREYKALRSVPASTWMEGFCVTKQMEKSLHVPHERRSVGDRPKSSRQPSA